MLRGYHIDIPLEEVALFNFGGQTAVPQGKETLCEEYRAPEVQASGLL